MKVGIYRLLYLNLTSFIFTNNVIFLWLCDQMRFEAKCDCTIAQNQKPCLKHCFNLLWRTLNEGKYFILVFSNCAIFFYTSYGIFHEFCEKLWFEVNNYYAKSQNIRSIGLNALFTVNSLDIFLQYIFEFV